MLGHYAYVEKFTFDYRMLSFAYWQTPRISNTAQFRTTGGIYAQFGTLMSGASCISALRMMKP